MSRIVREKWSENERNREEKMGVKKGKERRDVKRGNDFCVRRTI